MNREQYPVQAVRQKENKLIFTVLFPGLHLVQMPLEVDEGLADVRDRAQPEGRHDHAPAFHGGPLRRRPARSLPDRGD